MNTIKHWKERMDDYYAEPEGKLMRAASYFIELENEELRAALAARSTPASAVPTEQPIAEIGEDHVFLLRKQPNGDRWPKGTKLYAAAIADNTPSPASDVSAAIPEGWKLVPVEPTDEMLHDGKLRAAFDVLDDHDTGMEIEVVNMAEVWRDMLAAAPVAQADGEGVHGAD